MELENTQAPSEAGPAPETAAPEATPAPSIREALESAMGGAPQGETAEEKAARDYARDEAGRFAKAQEDAAKAAQEAPKQPEAPVWRPNWYKDEFGDWRQMPEPFRQALQERERAFAVEIQRRAEALKPWDTVNQALTEYQQELQAAGVTPHQYVQNLVQADRYLRTQPVEALQWIAKSYGVDLAQLAQQAIQGEQALTPEQRQYRAELEELRQLKAQQENWLRQQQEQQRLAQEAQERAEMARIEAEIQAFAKDRPHFETVRGLMAPLMDSGAASTLAEAYDMAVRAHPELGPRMLAEQQRAQAQKAKAAGVSSLRGAPTPGASSANPKDLRASLEAAWDSMM